MLISLLNMAMLGRVNMWVVVCCVLLLDFAAAQGEACYGGGSIAGAVLGTLLAIIVILGLVYVFYKYYWRNKKGKTFI